MSKQPGRTTEEPVTGPSTAHRAWLRPRRRRVVAVAVVLVLALPLPSYVSALTAPGAAAWTTRTVDWARDHGASPVVDALENAWYGLRPPSSSPPSTDQLPATTVALSPAWDRSSAPPAVVDAFPRSPVTGEGVWQARRADGRGAPLLATTFLRPDRDHGGVVVGVAWVRRTGVQAHLVAGTELPGGPAWPGSADVPRADVPSLVATFNSGWRTKDISGGFRIGDQTWPALQPGQATAVIDSHGRLDVGEWGRDVGPGSDVVAARQNLGLVVDGGRPVSGLASNAGHRWGYRDNQHQFTYRSALGVDAAGDLVYVAGPGLTLPVLADALSDAGAVRGMQLDVHPPFPFFAVWTHPGGRDAAARLLPSMGWAADRFLAPDQRDFFYLTTSSTS